MKSFGIWALSLCTLLTVVEPIQARASEVSPLASSLKTSVSDEQPPTRLSDLPMRLNPQIGVSSFSYSSDGNSKPALSGGATVEFGQAARKLETGLLVMSTSAQTTLRGDSQPTTVNSTYLTIPMTAKLRVVSLRAQSWYAKFGAAPAFEIASNHNSATSNLDILGIVGVGGRLAFNRSSDFVIEATYNHGMMDSLNRNGNDYNQGVLFLAGLSFRI